MDEKDKELVKKYIKDTKSGKLQWQRVPETSLWYIARNELVRIRFGLGLYALEIGSHEIKEEGEHMAGAPKEPLLAVLWDEVLKSLKINH